MKMIGNKNVLTALLVGCLGADTEDLDYELINCKLLVKGTHEDDTR
jgi:hypothetical protein